MYKGLEKHLIADNWKCKKSAGFKKFLVITQGIRQHRKEDGTPATKSSGFLCL